MEAVIAVGKALLATASKTLIWKAVGSFVLNTTIAMAAAYGISKLTAPKFETPARNPLQLTREPLTPHRIIYGRQRVGGSIRLEHTSGGDTNEYLHLVIIWACHLCHAVDELWLGDEVVPLDGSGNATGTYAGVVRAIHHLGAWNQIADATLIAEAGGAWTATDRLRGRCYTYLRVKNDDSKFPAGLPQPTAVIRGRLIYDPRELGQSATDPSTWTWSDNGALCAYDYARGVPQWNHAQELLRWWGGRLEDEDINQPVLIASANVCDEAVALDGGGTEPRYRANATIDADTPAARALEAFERAVGGKFFDIGGQLLIKAGAWQAPDVSLTDTALRGPVGFKSPLPWNEIKNVVGGTFRDPAQNWNRVPFPQVDSQTLIASDGAELRDEVDLDFVTSATQSQRLAKIRLLRTRQGLIHSLPCNLRALPALTGENYTFTFDPLGWNNKAWELLKFSLSVQPDRNNRPVFVTDLTGQETDSSVFDWATNEENPQDVAPNTTLPDPRIVPAPSNLSPASGGVHTDVQDDGTVVPRIYVLWDQPTDAFVYAGGQTRIEYGDDGAGVWYEWGVVKGDRRWDYILGLVPGSQWDVRIRHENRWAVGDWSAPVTITVLGDTTAPAKPTGLVASGKAGLIELDWADNTESDFDEYLVYRHTADDFVEATKIAQIKASRFIDASVTAGTTYFYWIVPVDTSENGNDATNRSDSASATATESLSLAIPPTPGAPTFNSHGTYDSGDGTVFAYVRINTPAVPSGAVVNEIVYRRDGSLDWKTADQQEAAGTARVDDLPPGVAYEFGVRSISNGGRLSAVSAVLDHITPNKTGLPTAPSGASISSEGVRPKFLTSTTKFLLGTRVGWSPSNDPDYAFTEVKATLTNSNEATDYSWTPSDGSNSILRTRETEGWLYTLNLLAGHVRARHVNNTGVASNWLYIGNANSAASIGTGTISTQAQNNAHIIGRRTGSVDTAKKVVAEGTVNWSGVLTGNNLTETEIISLPAGFTTKPDGPSAGGVTNAGILWRYDWDSASSTSGQVAIVFYMPGGGNIPASSAVRLQASFFQHA